MIQSLLSDIIFLSLICISMLIKCPSNESRILNFWRVQKSVFWFFHVKKPEFWLFHVKKHVFLTFSFAKVRILTFSQYFWLFHVLTFSQYNEIKQKCGAPVSVPDNRDIVKCHVKIWRILASEGNLVECFWSKFEFCSLLIFAGSHVQGKIHLRKLNRGLCEEQYIDWKIMYAKEEAESISAEIADYHRCMEFYRINCINYGCQWPELLKSWRLTLEWVSLKSRRNLNTIFARFSESLLLFYVDQISSSNDNIMDEMIYLQIRMNIIDLHRVQELFREWLIAILFMVVPTGEIQSIIIYIAK